MKDQNWPPKYKSSNPSMGRGEQSKVTSPSLSKLSEKELERVVGGAVYVGEDGELSQGKSFQINMSIKFNR